MSLTSEQLEAWEAGNRATVHPGKLNRWVWAVSTSVAKNDDDVFRVLKGATNRVGGARASDDFEVVRTSPSRLTPKGGTVQDRESLPVRPMPFVVPGKVIFAETQFAWRSPLTDVPWPAEAFRAGLLPVTDPEEADLMLVAVGPPAGEAKPDQSPGLDLIDDALDAAVETPARAVATVVVVGGLGYLLVRKLKS